MSKAIIVALIGAAGAIGANIATVAFPLVLQWGTYPPYLEHHVYKKIAKDFPRLHPVLEELLNKTESYYTSREISLEFVERVDNNFRINGITRTQARNALDRPIVYRHNISAMTDTRELYLTFSFPDGKSTTYTAADLDNIRRTSKGGLAFTTLTWEVPAGAAFTIESGYTMEKPVAFQEPLAVGKLLAGQITVTVKKPKIAGLLLEFLPLGFNDLTNDTLDPEGNRRITIAGPVFPGQGVNIIWKTAAAAPAASKL